MTAATFSHSGFLLGIDTSCDDTSVAILDAEARVVVNLISSQAEKHSLYGGVVPELASRCHMENLPVLMHAAFAKAGIRPADISGVAVTNTPGLIGCLLVGVSFAKALAYRLGVPLYAVNHLAGHLFSPFIGDRPEFPFLGLVVSGGHTAFYEACAFDDVRLIGQTVDDAAGEVFDKAAKMLGLGYPGGPLIEGLATNGNATRQEFVLPKVKMGPQYMSFSGIKTAFYQLVREGQGTPGSPRADLCAALQRAISEILCRQASYFLQRGEYRAFGLSGGVARNARLCRDIGSACETHGIACRIAAPEYCTDNAAMIAYAAYHHRQHSDVMTLNALASQKIQARELRRKTRPHQGERLMARAGRRQA